LDGDLSRSVNAHVRTLPANGGFQYRAELRGLAASRNYYYQPFVNGDAVTQPLRFRTPGPGPFTFLVFGDSGTGTAAQKTLAQRMIENEAPSLVLHTGDLSQESGTIEQLTSNYLDVYGPLMSRAAFFASPGNHDYYTDRGAACFAVHAPPPSDVPAEDIGRYFSFNWGNAHFVSLDSNLLEYPDASARMIEWLDRDLQRQTKFWKIVYFHHPPYPTGHHLTDSVSALVRNRVVPILERHGVHVVFTGHEHSYQRTLPLRGGEPSGGTPGTVYVISAGGGGVLHRIEATPRHAASISAHHYIRGEVRGSRLTLNVIGMDGQTIDRTTIEAPTSPVAEAVVNAGSFTPSIAQGSLISIFGRDLAVEDRAASKPVLPVELGGTTVTVNDERVPLLFVSPYQINAQLPYGIKGTVKLRVATRTASTEIDVDVADAAPALMQVPAVSGDLPAVYSASSGAMVSQTSPIVAGDYATMYAVGLGGSGVKAGEPTAEVTAVAQPVLVQIGSTTQPAEFAGLVPGVVGVYQVNFRVPAGTPEGANGLRLVVNSAASEPATMFVRAR
jgi:uncharacterized protein (TIGR03437 family)